MVLPIVRIGHRHCVAEQSSLWTFLIHGPLLPAQKFSPSASASSPVWLASCHEGGCVISQTLATLRLWISSRRLLKKLRSCFCAAACAGRDGEEGETQEAAGAFPRNKEMQEVQAYPMALNQTHHFVEILMALLPFQGMFVQQLPPLSRQMLSKAFSCVKQQINVESSLLKNDTAKEG